MERERVKKWVGRDRRKHLITSDTSPTYQVNSIILSVTNAYVLTFGDPGRWSGHLLVGELFAASADWMNEHLKRRRRRRRMKEEVREKVG